jgi:hypothetical protein
MDGCISAKSTIALTQHRLTDIVFAIRSIVKPFLGLISKFCHFIKSFSGKVARAAGIFSKYCELVTLNVKELSS